MDDEFLTTEELADLLRIPAATIYQWRLRGQGPPALKIGRHLRWRRTAVDEWLDSIATRAAAS
jgi:excisionase family DNA binding protein